MSRPITLYSHATGPNPWKVAIFLEELGIPYETEFLDFGVLKQEPFISVNPNGRVPAIKDPNTGVQLWESGAIIAYLIDTYDKENKLNYTEFPQKYEQKCWADFQMSGQGPYFGQKAWFTFFHDDKEITSAKDRYRKEIKRVTGVIDAHLKKTGKEYLVGDKISYADLMFVPWFSIAPWLLSDDAEGWKWEKELPTSYAWYERLIARPAVKKVLEAKQKKMQESS